MGMAPSASVYWGFDLGDMTDHDTWDSLKPAWMEESDGWEEVYAQRMGWQPVPFPEGAPDRRVWYTQFRGRRADEEHKKAEEAFYATAEYKAWQTAYRAQMDLAKQSPVELDTYGYIDEPGYCVKIRTSEQHPPDWGDIELNPLIVGDDWEAQIMAFMRLLELPLPKGAKPAWHVNCSYG